MKFVDEAVIDIRSGHGGPGSVHFMRGKFQPKMGPDGGDGGRGGSVFFEASDDMQSLLDFKFQPHFHAKDGEPGGGKDCNGHGGEDLVIKVPVGTELRNADNGELIADLTHPGAKVLAAKGGRGGLGNMNFATATRQAPDFAQPGGLGQQLKVKLELKLLADVALIGYPNAGKSTLISRLSAAHPKIADYPFTTLVPNLGVMRCHSRDVVIADIPGLIEGASEGRGLGTKFLKHCERTRLLVEVLDLDPSTGRNLRDEWLVPQHELKSFSEELAAKPKIVVLNKVDAFSQSTEDETSTSTFKSFLEERGYNELCAELKKAGFNEPLLISGVSGAGLLTLKDTLEDLMNHLSKDAPKVEARPSVEFSLGNSALLQ